MSSSEYSLEGWRELGFDNNSQYADPLFVNPEGGDFTLRPESAAFSMGFVEFPMDRYGLTGDYKLAKE